MTCTTFFAMGSYGYYVWPAYGITCLVFIINLIQAKRERRAIKKLFHSIINAISS